MTLDEFLSELSTTKWKIDNGYIRTEDDEYCFCPITYVYYKKSGLCFRNGMAAEIGCNLGLVSSSVYSIVHSADRSDGKFRSKLLEACGLCEQDGGT